jgi:SAM-dependent methyltransferase
MFVYSRRAGMATDKYAKSVNEQYGVRGLGTAILDGLRALGKDPDNISYTDLSSVDHFHTRGMEATRDLAQMADLRAGQRVVDVGGGFGGAARVLAAEFGCDVTVLDLTEEFCLVGEMLTARTGLSDRVTFKVGNALDMPFEDGSFDIAWTQHSSMNIADKERLYSEIRRVVRPGGRFALHEIMAGPQQPIHFPVPWAQNPQISFLLPPNEAHSIIAGTGFREAAWVDVTQVTLEWRRRMAALAAAAEAERGGLSPVGYQLLLGASFRLSFRNLDRNLEEGRIAVIEAVFDGG